MWYFLDIRIFFCTFVADYRARAFSVRVITSNNEDVENNRKHLIENT